jgi:ABC-2 type transport system ATP-binding protein/lipopolysaccharide transport system ATP-binding protein
VTAEPAIVVEGVGKSFRMYRDRRTNLKEIFTQRRRRSRYDTFQALDGVSLQVPRSSTFGLIGHNGSGKSTLLKLIAGIHQPTTGTVSARGRVSAMLELGAGFHPELSGRDNIYLNGAILGMSRRQIETAMDRIVAFSGIEEFIDTPVKVYSSGMYVRLGFSIAVNLDPEILVIDEIVAVGDEEFQRRCFEHLHELRRRGVTIIFVTHSMALVRQLCDDVAWLDHGRLRAVGKPGEVVDAYLAEVNAAETERLEQHPADGPVGTETRRGTGEVRITRLEYRDAAGRSRPVGLAGSPLTIRMHYEVREPVPAAIFGLGFHSENGVHVAGPNTAAAGEPPYRLECDGHIDYQLDPLPFAPGLYSVAVAVTDTSQLHVYDYQAEFADLRVQPGRGAEVVGLLQLAGRWRQLEPDRERKHREGESGIRPGVHVRLGERRRQP